MSGFRVVEKANHLAVHAHVVSEESGESWIERYGDSQMFMDKTLTRDSFEVIAR